MHSPFPSGPYFILSTGRTGTTFLYRFLNRHFQALACYQEPAPSWIFRLYANLCAVRQPSPWIEALMRKYFIRSRTRLGKAKSGPLYIEINPFLYGSGAMLTELDKSVRILHMVRHPAGYIESSLNFNPQGWRVLFKNFPVWNLNVSKAWRDKNIPWQRLSDIEKKAWQWVYINHKLKSYASLAAGYLRVRFEDLFESDAATRRETLLKITGFLGLPFPENYREEIFSDKANASNPVKALTLSERTALQRIGSICADLMNEFGYAAASPAAPSAYAASETVLNQS